MAAVSRTGPFSLFSFAGSAVTTRGRLRFVVAAHRTRFALHGGMAEWLCSGLQSRGRRFDSDSRLQYFLVVSSGG